MKLKEQIKIFDESFNDSSGEPTKTPVDLFAGVEQLQREIRDKDKIIENLKNESTELKNKISNGEKEKFTILEELKKSGWLENKVTLSSKYKGKLKTILGEIKVVDTNIISMLTAVGRKKQGNQKLNWDGWLKIPENRYLYAVNEDIAKGVCRETNTLIERTFAIESVRGSGAQTTPTTIYGLEFDGLTNEVATTFSGGGATPINRTYSFWMKSTHTARNHSVFGYGTNKRGTFTPNFSSNRPLIWNGNNWYVYWDDTSAQDDGEWHHWMVYNDVETIVDSKLYVDGILIEVNKFVTSGTVSNLLLYTQSLTIGAYKNNSTNTGHHFEGSITNFAVYSGDKTDDATAHYNNGTPKDLSGESDLQGYWKMDENAGTTVADSSGNGNDGTIDGASWITVMEN